MKSMSTCLLLLSCAAAAAVSVEDAVRDVLKDPESARFFEIRRFPNGNACGFVNAKNSYGGYVGKQPFEYSQGYVHLNRPTYSVACERAADPSAFDARIREAERAAAAQAKDADAARQAKARASQEAARAAEAATRARHAAEQARREEESYSRCSAARDAAIAEAKMNIDQLWAELSPSSIKGMASLPQGGTLDVADCPTRFRSEIAPIVDEERRRLYQGYCIDRRAQRLRESLVGNNSFIAKACGAEYLKALDAEWSYDLVNRVKSERSANQELWDCRLMRDYAIAGDKMSRLYWGREFESKCAGLKGRLD